MAARLNRRTADAVRERIRVSLLIRRLMQHSMGEIELKDSQIRSIEILLRKAIPDLKSVEHTGGMTIQHVREMTDEQLYALLAGNSSGTADEAAIRLPAP